MAQALGNLMSNAIRYTPAGGTVSVIAGVGKLNVTNEAGGPRKNHLWIRVEDAGPGIPADEQELVFTPFYRSPSIRRFPQGMGLGLTIARDMVSAHGGQLILESTPGKGSAFTIMGYLYHHASDSIVIRNAYWYRREPWNCLDLRPLAS